MSGTSTNTSQGFHFKYLKKTTKLKKKLTATTTVKDTAREEEEVIFTISSGRTGRESNLTTSKQTIFTKTI